MHLMNCPVCGKRIPFNSPHCQECDLDLTEYIHDTNSKKRGLGKRIISIIAIAMIILVMVDIGINLWSNTGHKVELPSVDADPSSTDLTYTPTTTAKQYDPESPDVSEAQIISDVPTPSRTPTHVPNDVSNPVGVYNGNDGNVLVLNDNGLAYYYCSDIEFTELELPWVYSDDKLSVQFSKLHCNPSAIIDGDDFSNFTLRLDSENWDDESFTRINVDPNEYIKRKVFSYVSSVNVNSDGSLSFSLDNLMFTVPKQYRNPPNITELGENAISFVDNDVDSDYISTLLFYQDNMPIEDDFYNRFLEEAETQNQSDIIIAGHQAKSYTITGVFNTGFPTLSGIRQTGFYTVIPNPSNNTVVYILMLQTENRSIDNSELFSQIISECKIK